MLIIICFFFVLKILGRRRRRRQCKKEYSYENLNKAMAAISMGLSFREAGRQYEVPRTTLQRYFKLGIPTSTLARFDKKMERYKFNENLL